MQDVEFGEQLLIGQCPHGRHRLDLHTRDATGRRRQFPMPYWRVSSYPQGIPRSANTRRNSCTLGDLTCRATGSDQDKLSTATTPLGFTKAHNRFVSMATPRRSGACRRAQRRHVQDRVFRRHVVGASAGRTRRRPRRKAAVAASEPPLRGALEWHRTREDQRSYSCPCVPAIGLDGTSGPLVQHATDTRRRRRSPPRLPSSGLA
jgi:hypothetical protein